MKQTAVEWLAEKYDYAYWMVKRDEISPVLAEEWKKHYLEQAKEMEKEQELKIKIQCLKESLQFIDANYMAELLNIRIYNMEKELLTFKSE